MFIPQSAATARAARESALDANLSTMRASIELYRVQHRNNFPGAAGSNGAAATTCTGVAGTGAVNSAQAFVDQLTRASDEVGNTCTVADNTFRFGPYMRGALPAEPITGRGALPAEIVITTTGVPLAPAAPTGGWAYDTRSGQLAMNSNALDNRGRVFSAH
jgi:hypothetical protein